MFLIDFSQLIYLAIVIFIGGLILYVRRKAKAGRSLYKLLLILTGIILASLTFNGSPVFSFDKLFLRNLSGLLLVVLMFELSMRLSPDNISFKKKNIMTFFLILLANILAISILSLFLLKTDVITAMVFSIIISSVEYFLVDELKEEGDFANPFLLLFAFSLMFFYNLEDTFAMNIGSFLQYILIGLAMGIALGIIVSKSVRGRKITWFHEIGLISIALVAYIFTNNIGGSGLFAVMVIGTMFGNSYVKKRSNMTTFSPFIFKNLEVLIFLLLGFSVAISISKQLIVYGIILFLAYLITRFIILSIIDRKYSGENIILLTFAPKGMVFVATILILSNYGGFSGDMINIMLIILVLSLISTAVFEYFEKRKIEYLEKVYTVLRKIRYGRRTHVHSSNRKIDLFAIFKRH